MSSSPRCGSKASIGSWLRSARRPRRSSARPAGRHAVGRDLRCRGRLRHRLLRDGRLSLAYFSDPDLLPNGLSSDLPAWRALAGETHYVSRWLSDAGFPIVAPPRLVSAGTACLDRAAGTSPSGAGWAAAGDAAAAFDPLSSHGITTALWSGMKAGRTAADWLAGRPRVLEDYGAAVRSSFTSFLEQRRTYYGAERRFQECHFWTRRREPAAIAVPA